jgi:hypothetical protein
MHKFSCPCYVVREFSGKPAKHEEDVMVESLIPPEPPTAADLRATTKTLSALLEYMVDKKTFTTADIDLVRDALELLGRIRPDLNPAQRMKV